MKSILPQVRPIIHVNQIKQFFRFYFCHDSEVFKSKQIEKILTKKITENTPVTGSVFLFSKQADRIDGYDNLGMSKPGQHMYTDM